MRVSELFGETLRKPPADAVAISHQLLARAGYIRQVAPGAFALLPPGYRSLEKIALIVREEIEAAGGVQIYLPALFSGEAGGNGSAGLPVQGKTGRSLALTETAEAVLAGLCNTEINSYRQLPRLLYQFPTRYCHEARSYGGLLCTREYLVQESYSLDRDAAGLKQQYERLLAVYWRVCERIGLPVNVVEGARGYWGGAAAHEFVYRTPDGEEEALFCTCGYAAKREIARFKKELFPGGQPAPLTKTATPGTATIEALSEFLGIDPRQTAKVVFYHGEFGESQPPKLLVCVVRGDMDASEALIRQVGGVVSLRAAEAAEIRAAGCEPGFASPIGIDREKARVIVDDLIPRSANLVTGANEADFHYLNSNYGRDYTADRVGHIALAPAEARCAECGEALHRAPCVKIAGLLDLGTSLSAAANATYLDENGKPRPIFLGSYNIGLTRLLAALAEEYHDDFGLAFPRALAPFQVTLIQLKGEKTAELAPELYAQLCRYGLEVLYDDRNVSAGVKFNDADLRGIPLRITVSDRALEQGGVEIKLRSEKERKIVPADALIDAVREMLGKLAR